MMRINILTPIPFWHPGTQELIDGLRKNNITVVALDIWELRYFDEKNQIHELIPKYIKGFFAKVYRRLFRKNIIKTYIHKNDVVDIQWCGYYYAKYMDTIKKQNVKIIATLFGADFLGSTTDERYIQSKIFDVADKIVMGINMEKTFVEFYSTKYSYKITHNQFGSKRLDIIQELNTPENKIKFRNKYKIPINKIVTSVGYNARTVQQHMLFLNLLDVLTQEEKNKLFLILPLTYGVRDEYVKGLKLKLNSLKIDFLCIGESTEKKDVWISDEELAEIRILSDIIVSVQIRDALSSSIKESFLANNVVLVGDWITYDVFEDLNIFFIRSNLNSFIENYRVVFSNIQLYKDKGALNGQKIMDFASWKAVLPQFIKIYTEI